MDETSQTHQPIMITGKRNNVVMISEEDWNAIEETLYLNSVTGMADSIKEAMDAPDSEFSEDIEW
jgi:PHD/YefM family antitoxin component YafN of YafNO toxin-antitoxin module